MERFTLTVIQNGLNIDDFAPRDIFFSRDVLGIPQDADTLLFIAESVDNRRKGFNLLIDALYGISNMPKLYLVTIGKLKENLQSRLPNTILGAINNDRLLSLIYSAADLCIIPSIQDNLPNTVMESLSCGTPVIGFDVGGIREMIQEGTNGYLVSAKDVNALRCKIIETLSEKENLKKMSENCRKSAIEKYSIGEQAKKYIDLYNFLLKKP